MDKIEKMSLVLCASRLDTQVSAKEFVEILETLIEAVKKAQKPCEFNPMPQQMSDEAWQNLNSAKFGNPPPLGFAR